MRDTRNRRYIKRPEYAPTKCKPYGEQTYSFAYAYIQKETGLEIIYESTEPAKVWEDLEGNIHKSKSKFYLSFATGDYITRKIGVTYEDILTTEAENGYTDHLEAILNGLEIDVLDDEGRRESEKALIADLLKKASKAKAEQEALKTKWTEA